MAVHDRSAMQRELRERLIQTLAASAGSRKKAEFVVNNLTVHNTDLLAEAAVWFARNEVKAWLGNDQMLDAALDDAIERLG